MPLAYGPTTIFGALAVLVACSVYAVMQPSRITWESTGHEGAHCHGSVCQCSLFK